MDSFMKEPLLWFVVIGVILFTVDNYQSSDPIVVNDAVRNEIVNLWEAQMGSKPVEKDLTALVRRWVREETFYREAIHLGLDREDVIIRRRLIQKLEFIAEDINDGAVTEEDVEMYYESNQKKYRQPIQYSFSHVYFTIKADSELYESRLARGVDWMALGDATLLPREVVEKDKDQVAAILGIEFSNELDNLAVGKWLGPIQSAFGYHLVRMETLKPEIDIPFTAIKKKVVDDFLYDRREVSLEDYYQKLQGFYDIVYE
jgi:peptidyl-prolyl cis-trans isomerase C